MEKIVAINGATAHPHIDKDGTIHNLGAVHKGGFKYTIVKFTPPKPGRLRGQPLMMWGLVGPPS